MSGQLIKSSAIVSALTFISRILGFVRDMLIARLFGVDVNTDAFFVAFKIPNLFRRLFSEGAFAHALVPVISTYQKDEARICALRDFIAKMAGSLAVWASLITLASIFLAPAIVFCIAPGFAQETQYDVAVSLLKIQLPYGLCITLVAFSGAVLNAHKRYAIPAITPVFLNLCMIATALWLAPLLDRPVDALAWGVVIAGIVQVAVQLPGLWRLRLLPRLNFIRNDPEVARVNRLLLPAVFSASITQINLLFDTLIASFLTNGSVSWLYYSDRLVEFPLGILGVGLATVILPSLSGTHVAEDAAAFSRTLDWGLRLALVIGVPATIGLFMLAEPMLSTLFQYDEFTASDVHQAGLSLKAYSLGLLGYLLIKILVPGFTARLDLKTPVRFGMIAMAASLLLNVLAIPMAHAGLALATSIGATLNGLLLLIKLRRDRVYSPGGGWWLFIVRVIASGTAMAWFINAFVEPGWWHSWHTSARVGHLLEWIVLSCLVYFGTLFLCGTRLRHLLMTNAKISGL